MAHEKCTVNACTYRYGSKLSIQCKFFNHRWENDDNFEFTKNQAQWERALKTAILIIRK